MLQLDSPRWSNLKHAYGCASNIPGLLGQLTAFPAEATYQDEPWFTLWSSLYHQGDIYPASFAAVPHIVAALARDPARASFSYFLPPASIEVARAESSVAVPPDVEPSYWAALVQLPQLAAAASRPHWDRSLCMAALAVTAAATGNHQVARLLLETERDDIHEVIEWLQSR